MGFLKKFYFEERLPQLDVSAGNIQLRMERTESLQAAEQVAAHFAVENKCDDHRQRIRHAL